MRLHKIAGLLSHPLAMLRRAAFLLYGVPCRSLRFGALGAAFGSLCAIALILCAIALIIAVATSDTVVSALSHFFALLRRQL